jgi:MFS family permease
MTGFEARRVSPQPPRKAPYWALLSAYSVSMLGTSMSQLAIPWMVLTTTGSASKTGLVAFAEMGPYVVAQVLAGPVVDRVGLRRSFVWGNLAAAVALGAIPFLYAADVLSLGALLAVVALAGTARGGADCANMALVPSTATLGEIPLERAAGLNTGANRLAIMLGAPTAGVLVALFGSPLVVLLDAITFVVAAVVVAIFLRGVPEPIQPEGLEPGLKAYGRGLREGFAFVGRDRLLLGLILMVAASNFLDQGMQEVLTPVWVREELGSPAALGAIAGVFGLGSVIGNLVGAWIGPRVPRLALYRWGFLLGGAPRYFALVIFGSLSPVLAVELSTAMVAGSINPIIGATAYDRIPEHLRARVLGVVRASAWATLPFGALAAGLATEAWGVRNALIIAGTAYFLVTLVPFVFPVWKEMKRPEPGPVVSQRSGSPSIDPSASDRSRA